MRSALSLLLFVFAAISICAGSAPAQCELSNLTASDGAAGDRFGDAVSISGDLAIIGASGEDLAGSAYVFERQGSSWVETAKLVPSDGKSDDEFGSSVSISGDVAIIGAHRTDDLGPDSGSAYVFERQGYSWIQIVKLISSDGASDDRFGYSVSISGNTIVVGARLDDVGIGFDSGSAFVFERQATGWKQVAKLTASDAAIGDEFGFAVSMSRDTVVVGARRGDVFTGSAYIFEEPASGWTSTSETAKLTASDGMVGDEFGWSAAISPERVIIGAHGDDSGVGFDSGSAYLFERPVGGWVSATETEELIASDAVAGDHFGYSVAVSGNRVLVGANEDGDGGYLSGSAYLFEKSGVGWVERGELIASDASQAAYFGEAVSLSDRTVLIGAFGDDDFGFMSGAAYLFWLGPCLIGPSPGVVSMINTVSVLSATPYGTIALGVSTVAGSTALGVLCSGLMTEPAHSMLIEIMNADGDGAVNFSVYVSASLGGTKILLQAVDVSGCQVSNLVSYTFP